jgi:hypothetical protein
MYEDIIRVENELLKKSGEEYKDFIPTVWSTLKEKEVEDYLDLLKESPDFVVETIVKALPKTAEYIQICDPEEDLLIVKDSLPVLLKKLEKYGIEKFVDEIKDLKISDKLVDKFPEMMREIDGALQKTDPAVLNSYGKTYKGLILDSIIPFMNRATPSLVKLHRDIEESFDKLNKVKLNIGIDLKDMDLQLKEKIDKGTIIMEEGLENTDVRVTISTEAILEIISVLLSGSKWKMTRYILSGAIPVEGSTVKALNLIPFALKLSKLMSYID